ncbi:MAG: hypothetical protein IPL06_10420 [Betaproteobacteria bacterium]|nr:hypothetical protein [Betaproteobacteria bacterium]
MKNFLILPALAVLLAGCAGMEAPSEQGKTEISTGSNIPRRVGVRDRDVVTGSKEEYERQMDKAHTLPRSKEAQY